LCNHILPELTLIPPEMSGHSHSEECPSQGHPHSHGHSHGHGHDAGELSEANRKYLDSIAEDGGYDLQVISVTNQVAEVLHTRYALNSESTVIMGYACETGSSSLLQGILILSDAIPRQDVSPPCSPC
jgi:glutamate/tyrosine decarboxylase-like PLP-dependent enzyme